MQQELPACVKITSDGFQLAVKVQPRASQNVVDRMVGDELRVRVTAPPVESAANEAVLRFLADRLVCSRNRLQLVRGHASRHKIILITGMSVASALEKLGLSG